MCLDLVWFSVSRRETIPRDFGGGGGGGGGGRGYRGSGEGETEGGYSG